MKKPWLFIYNITRKVESPAPGVGPQPVFLSRRVARSSPVGLGTGIHADASRCRIEHGVSGEAASSRSRKDADATLVGSGRRPDEEIGDDVRQKPRDLVGRTG